VKKRFFCELPHEEILLAQACPLRPEGHALRKQYFPRGEKSAKNFILKKFRQISPAR